MESTPSFKEAVVNEAHPSKAWSPIEVVASGRSIVPREVQFWNAPLPTAFKAEGITMEAIPEHP